MTRRSRGGARVAITLAIALVAVSCATPPSPASQRDPSGQPGPSRPSSPAPLPTATQAPVVTATPAPLPTADASPPAVLLDESLLEILPADVDGVPVGPESQSFTDAASDPDFAANVEAAAFFVVVDGSDLASGGVARLRPDVFSEAFFRDWRDTYNTGACSQAGGVTGNAEATIGGRTVYITSCAGGLRAYHAYLEERGVIISLISLGVRRFGEQLMRALAP